MTTVTLTPELERAVNEAAQGRGLTAEAVVLETLREKFLPVMQAAGADDATPAAAADVDARHGREGRAVHGTLARLRCRGRAGHRERATPLARHPAAALGTAHET